MDYKRYMLIIVREAAAGAREWYGKGRKRDEYQWMNSMEIMKGTVVDTSEVTR